MPSNHPWKSKTREFTCPPNCPERKPACQSHCERHIREKALHEALRAAQRLERDIDGYTSHAITVKRDESAKRARNSRSYIHKTD